MQDDLCNRTVPQKVASKTENKLYSEEIELSVSPYRVIEIFKRYPRLLHRFFIEMTTRGVYSLPRSFRHYVLKNKPERIYENRDKLLSAIRASVLGKRLNAVKALKILDLKDEKMRELAIGIVINNPNPLLLAELPEEFRKISRLKQRAHVLVYYNPFTIRYFAKLFDSREFYEDALNLFSEGFYNDALAGLIYTLRGTNDLEGLRFVLKHGSKSDIKKALEMIITDKNALY